jgi:hypothetical protein
VTGSLVTLFGAEVMGYPRNESEEHGLAAVAAIGSIVGGLSAGMVARALSGSPDARAWVTAVSLAPVYAFAISFTID